MGTRNTTATIFDLVCSPGDGASRLICERDHLHVMFRYHHLPAISNLAMLAIIKHQSDGAAITTAVGNTAVKITQAVFKNVVDKGFTSVLGCIGTVASRQLRSSPSLAQESDQLRITSSSPPSILLSSTTLPSSASITRNRRVTGESSAT